MKRFLVLYKSSVPATQQMASATPEQMKAGMELWNVWAQKAHDAIVDLGMPLGHANEVIGASVRQSDTMVSGYSILQAESDNAAVELLKDHPHQYAPGASIEVLEMIPLPGM